MNDPNDTNSGGGGKPAGDGGPSGADSYEVIEPEPRKETRVGDPIGSSVVGAPKLLRDFDEDADFDHDPEVAAASAGKRKPPTLIEVEEESLVKPGLGDERVWAIVGVVLMIGAVICVLVNEETNTAWRSLLVVAQCFVQSATGVAALGAAASLGQIAIGKLDLAAARMFAMVAMFQLIFHLSLQVSSGKFDEIVVASLAYVLGLWVLFRRPIDQTMLIAGFHFLGWFVVFVMGQLYAQATAVHPAAGG